MPTPEYGFPTPVIDADVNLASALMQNFGQKVESFLLADGDRTTPGFWSATDIIGTVVAGSLAVSVSAGRAYVGPTGSVRLAIRAAVGTVTNGVDQGGLGGVPVIAANAINYFWVKKDGTFVVNTTGVVPVAGDQLAFIMQTGATQGTAIDNTPPGRLQSARRTRGAGRPATGHIRLAANPNDTDTLTITTGLVVVVYEFDNNAAVTAGRILVTIGASAAATATNLAAAILANQGIYLGAAAHATDTTVVDIATLAKGGILTLAESTGGARVVVRDNGEELTTGDRQLYVISRVVVAEDVTRTRIRVDTRMTSILYYQFRLRTSAASNVEIGYTGAVTISGGVIEFGAGGTNFAAGNILDLLVVGT
jgi:hypothetical protein